MGKNTKKLIFLLSLLILLSCLFIIIKNNTLYDDEFGHFSQIKLFLEGKLEIYKGISLIPGYHLITAVIAKLTGLTSVPELRIISYSFSLLTIITFFKITQVIDPHFSFLKTFQFAFFPVLFPYLFLLYNESLSILLVLLSFYSILLKKNFLGGIFSIISVLVRQTNFVWLVFFFIYIYLRKYSNKSNLINFIKYSTENWV